MLYHTEFSSRLFGFKVVLVYKSQFGSAITVSLGKNRVDRLNVCVAVDYLLSRLCWFTSLSLARYHSFTWQD